MDQIPDGEPPDDIAAMQAAYPTRADGVTLDADSLLDEALSWFTGVPEEPSAEGLTRSTPDPPLDDRQFVVQQDQWSPYCVDEMQNVGVFQQEVLPSNLQWDSSGRNELLPFYSYNDSVERCQSSCAIEPAPAAVPYFSYQNPIPEDQFQVPFYSETEHHPGDLGSTARPISSVQEQQSAIDTTQEPWQSSDGACLSYSPGVSLPDVAHSAANSTLLDGDNYVSSAAPSNSYEERRRSLQTEMSWGSDVSLSDTTDNEESSPIRVRQPASPRVRQPSSQVSSLDTTLAWGYQCKFCPLRYQNKAKMRKHLVHHLDLRPMECRHCSKTFNWTQVADSHVKLVHGYTSGLSAQYTCKDVHVDLLAHTRRVKCQLSQFGGRHRAK